MKDGFSPKFVSEVLQEIEDQELLEMDESGDVKPADIGFWRTDKGWRTEFVSRRASVEGKEGPYYVLRLSDLLPEIQNRIMKESEGR